MEAGAKVVGLIRVSTDEQGDSRLGLEAQREAIRAECERRRWMLVDVIVESGVSGRSSDRPGLRRALDRIGSGSAHGLVVAKFDRLSRSVIDFSRTLEWLRDAGAFFVAIDMDIDTSKASGELIAHILMSVAQWEARAISERTTDALSAKRARGEAISRPAVPNDVQDRIRALRADGLSMQRIADTLTADGVPTARGAAKWSASAVQTSLGYKRPKRRKAADLPPVPSRRRAQA